MMSFQASTFILSFIMIIMFLSIVTSEPSCGMNEFSMCIPDPECNRCDGECFCIDPKPIKRCNPACILPKKCIEGNCVCVSINCPKWQECQNDGTCGYQATISKLSDEEVTSLTRFITYCAISYCP